MAQTCENVQSEAEVNCFWISSNGTWNVRRLQSGTLSTDPLSCYDNLMNITEYYNSLWQRTTDLAMKRNVGSLYCVFQSMFDVQVANCVRSDERDFRQVKRFDISIVLSQCPVWLNPE